VTPSVAAGSRRGAGLPKMRPSPPETAMTLHRLLARTLSLSLAFVLTAGMLGGIDHLAQTDPDTHAHWAQRGAAPRA
jgi:hypothetical protein